MLSKLFSFQHWTAAAIYCDLHKCWVCIFIFVWIECLNLLVMRKSEESTRWMGLKSRDWSHMRDSAFFYDCLLLTPLLFCCPFWTEKTSSLKLQQIQSASSFDRTFFWQTFSSKCTTQFWKNGQIKGNDAMMRLQLLSCLQKAIQPQTTVTSSGLNQPTAFKYFWQFTNLTPVSVRKTAATFSEPQ